MHHLYLFGNLCHFLLGSIIHEIEHPLISGQEDDTVEGQGQGRSGCAK